VLVPTSVPVAPKRPPARPKAANIETTSASEVRAELQGMTLMRLQKRAMQVGVDEDVVEAAVDGDSPKADLVALILALEAPCQQEGTGNSCPEVVTDTGTVEARVAAHVADSLVVRQVPERSALFDQWEEKGSDFARGSKEIEAKLEATTNDYEPEEEVVDGTGEPHGEAEPEDGQADSPSFDGLALLLDVDGDDAAEAGPGAAAGCLLREQLAGGGEHAAERECEPEPEPEQAKVMSVDVADEGCGLLPGVDDVADAAQVVEFEEAVPEPEENNWLEQDDGDDDEDGV
jgi:hypothetical protein